MAPHQLVAGHEEIITNPRGVLEITWHGAGAGDDEFTIEIDCADEPDAAYAPISERHKCTIVRLLSSLEIYAKPRPKAPDPAKAVAVGIALTLRAPGDSQGNYQVLLPDVQLFGSRLLLARLTVLPNGGWLLVNAAPAIQPEAPAELAELLAALDSGTQSAAIEKRNLVLVLDRTASMHTHFRSGLMGQVLTAISAVNVRGGAEGTPDTWLFDRDVHRVHPRTDPVALGVELLAQDRWFTGSALMPVAEKVAAMGSGDRALVLVVTDGLPPDFQEFCTSVSAARELGESARWHLVPIAKSKFNCADEHVAEWEDELIPLRRYVENGVLTVTSVSPVQGTERKERIGEADQHILAASLLSAICQSVFEDNPVHLKSLSTGGDR